MRTLRRLPHRVLLLAVAMLVSGGLMAGAVGASGATTQATYFGFKFAHSKSTCLPNAHANGVITFTGGVVERLKITMQGGPANPDFATFVIQVPKAPFGIAWYFGDLLTDQYGYATTTLAARFSDETFAVAPGVAPAPNTHPGKDATQNPAFLPVHTY